ncbi:hypothetical protein EV643_12450 [Kribbella sp. VKM Ac-2527]|uniref:Uncharacterized protein n=1 Tax=Kribbella caucasensis TaxID=2512215 RepID=A0A4R6JGL4_9ACTN|nr:DUF6299 family protein [Kribbella sp. VKM Ac-2527]TDO35164.1 hypothetical protein EV643_12450 [Kribbella sp. VKM Ac-2527]
MRHLRSAVLSALVLGTLITSAGTALAAAPGNDTYGGRTVVGAVPFTDSLDTTEATTDSDDTDINANCGAPANDASVWYEFTPGADDGIAVDVSSSTYSAGAIVATGSPGNWSLVACGPGAVAWMATAGTTYTVLVFDDQLDGGGNGGTLNLTIGVIPPPPTVDITVNRFAQFNSRTGTATVSGSAICTGEPDFTAVETTLSQQVGRFTVRGIGFSDILCDGTPRLWSVEVLPDNGKFAGGKAASVTFAFACGPFECGIDFEERIVQLRGR